MSFLNFRRAGKIFINYRRDDSRADAGRLYDRLQTQYPGRIFRDVGSLEPGVEWHEAITKVLGSSDACIVVIGKNWLTIKDDSGKRRLDDPRDTVRHEVLTALKNGMRVFPVLVGGARMPAEEELPADLQTLARRNALEMTEQDWDEDFKKLSDAIERTLGWKTKKPVAGIPLRPIMIGVAAAVVFLALLGAVFNAVKGSGNGSSDPADGGGSGKRVSKPPSSITLRYSGDYLNCTLGLQITVGDQTVMPTANFYKVRDVTLGSSEYEVQGSIMCPVIGGCRASGSGPLFLRNNAVYDVSWRNVAYGTCLVILTDSGS